MARFESVENGFHILGFRIEEIHAIYRVLAAILHLGEIRFGMENEEDGCSIKNHDELETGSYGFSTQEDNQNEDEVFNGVS